MNFQRQNEGLNRDWSFWQTPLPRFSLYFAFHWACAKAGNRTRPLPVTLVSSLTANPEVNDPFVSIHSYTHFKGTRHFFFFFYTSYCDVFVKHVGKKRTERTVSFQWIHSWWNNGRIPQNNTKPMTNKGKVTLASLWPLPNRGDFFFF